MGVSIGLVDGGSMDMQSKLNRIVNLVGVEADKSGDAGDTHSEVEMLAKQLLQSNVHPGDVYLDWTEAEKYDEEFNLLYRG